MPEHFVAPSSRPSSISTLKQIAVHGFHSARIRRKIEAFAIPMALMNITSLLVHSNVNDDVGNGAQQKEGKRVAAGFEYI